MKLTKRLVSLLLTLVLTLTLGIPVFAAGEKGSITINNAVENQIYTIYRIFDLESYNAEADAYSYKVNSNWKDFINQETIKGVYVEVDNQDYVTWKESASVADFAKAAIAYATEHNIANQGSDTATTTTLKFENLDLGYYLVDSSLGALCGLTTTNPDATINEKNAEPTNEKKVEEDSTGLYGSENDADINQVVNFSSIITVQGTAKDYVFHDKMSVGLTFQSDSVKITLNDQEVADTNYELKLDYKHGEETDTFAIIFKEDFCKSLNTKDTIVISYSAKLNEQAVIGESGNPNQSKLSYSNGDKTETTPSKTVTRTWEVNVFKFTKDEETEKALAGAEFQLYKLVNEVKTYAIVINGKINGWATNETEATTLISDTMGKIKVQGLDADRYFLSETKAPDGYNKLDQDVSFVIDNEGNVKATSDGEALPNKTVKIENKSSSLLPSTGGIGTKIFYTLGALLAVGAGVLLITKKRMKKVEE